GGGLAAGASGVPAGLVFEIPGLELGAATGAGVSMDLAATALWVLSSLTVLVVLLRGHVMLRKARRSWRPERVLGHDVFVSETLGPAVAGVLRPRTVLPAWALDLPKPQLRLIVEHEKEHERARDPQWLAAALLVVGTTAWNPVGWWALRRLRDAIEIDCDHRVLGRVPGTMTYGESLLAVAARMPRSSVALAAFTESPHSLERRLIAMTTHVSRRTRITGGALLVAAALLGIQACGVDSPLSDGDGASEDAMGPAVTSSIAAGPQFTPFTVAPSIANRVEVIDAMEREYPPLLRDAGVGGTVRVYFYITETGEVGERRIDESSGHEALDRAALRVASVYRFTPALNRDDPVPVWVSFPITFQVGS
ncbi:MAG: M56 family metallopeptidase, partial [Gemmatimonadota bacterium]